MCSKTPAKENKTDDVLVWGGHLWDYRTDPIRWYKRSFFLINPWSTLQGFIRKLRFHPGDPRSKITETKMWELWSDSRAEILICKSVMIMNKKKGNLRFTITVETNWESKWHTVHQADHCYRWFMGNTRKSEAEAQTFILVYNNQEGTMQSERILGFLFQSMSAISIGEREM